MKYCISAFLILCSTITYTKNIPFILKHTQELTKRNHYAQAYSALRESISHCKTAKEKVDVANALLQIGLYYFDQRESKKSLDAFNSILHISDRFSVAHHNIGFVYTEQLGDFDSAIPAFETALALNSDNAATHFCYALALLSQGSLLKGFQEYEWRWQRGARSPRNFATYPLEKQWTGQPLGGKTIFLRAEQGLGDTLHFIRYAELLNWMGAHVIAEVQDVLKPLISLCPYLHTVITIHESPPPFDYQIPYLSIPAVVQTTLETIPGNVPYLFAHPDRLHAWQQFFADKQTTFNIGICWHGDNAHTDDKFMPINCFGQLAEIEQVRLFSLQKQSNEEDKSVLFALHHFNNQFDTKYGSFMDTAAVMQQLDLIITVDTSIAHLAGALGVPVWVILPFPAEWRWLTERSDSPWYPTMRLFRQTTKNDWTTVIQQIKKEVAERACKK